MLNCCDCEELLDKNMFTLPDTPPSQTTPILSVAALNRLIRQTLEQRLPLTWVAGEISNLTRASSGHWYFSLKDAGAQVRCVMFRNRNQFIDWQPDNGMQVEVRATPTLYEPRGEFQLQVDTLRRAGLGALFEAFEALKLKLGSEGLFNADKKRGLPVFPRRVGIITSPQAAALHDVLTTLQRRMPSLPVVLYPTQVQGRDAAAQIVTALHAAYQRAECDVLIVCRGGGSIEDLWSFNEENVARAIAASPIPVVSAIGHETDFTIADFVADLRAPTPTAAAELVCSHQADWLLQLRQLHSRMVRQAQHRLYSQTQQLDYLARNLVHPGRRIAMQLGTLNQLARRLKAAQSRMLERHTWQHTNYVRRLQRSPPPIAHLCVQTAQCTHNLTRAIAHQLDFAVRNMQRMDEHLFHLNPHAVLARGYSIVQNAQGEIVHDSTDLQLNETLDIQFAKGRVKAVVTHKSE
jgi:exodeoxyribonuclease VII large subunit